MTWLDDRAMQDLRDVVAERALGDVLGDRFELRQRIGEGAMGTVYAAIDRETGDEVAVKVLSDATEPRFAREVELLRTIEHPAIVRYRAHGEGWLVMDRLRGCSLHERLRRGALTVEEIVFLARRLASGLAAMHAAGVTHRDLKPSNVFLVDERADDAKILDFGLARSAGMAAVTEHGARVGTPGYMSPEQIRGENALPPSDVFALGCILHESATTRPPFEAEGTETLFARVLVSEPEALRRVPAELSSLVTRLMAKDPAGRPTAAEAARELESLSVPAGDVTEGKVLAGKYAIEGRLGEGGMGIVLAARHLDLGTQVALKIMRTPDTSDQARFLREARAASRLESEHVARVLDVGRAEDGAPFMVMERLNGSDLAAIIAERGPLDVPRAAGYLLQACEAIAEAHVLGIVHRDLKPSNLFVVTRRDGTELVKVLDFGISKITRPESENAPSITMTDGKVVIGSIAYMSPEQLEGAADVDHRTDIWALGVVLHELVTGKRPFDGDNAAAIGARIAAGTPRSMDAPREVEAIVLRCLAKRPDERFQDVGALCRALVPFAPEGRSSVARIERLLGTPSRPEKKRSRSTTVAAGAAFLSGIAAVIFVASRASVPAATHEPPPPVAATVSIPASAFMPPPDPMPPAAPEPKVDLRPRPVVSPPRKGPPPVRSAGVDLQDPALLGR